MAKFYLMFLIWAILAIPFCAKCERGVYPIISNLSLLPLGILVYLEGLAFGSIGAVSCILFFFLYLFYIGVEFTSVLPTLFAFGATPIIIDVFKGISKNIELSMAEDLAVSEKEMEAAKGQDAGLDKELQKLDKEVSGIAGLYEITRAMSSTLLFSEIFQILSEFLKSSFQFISCKLILAPHAEAKKSSGRVYKIEADSTSVTVPEAADIGMLQKISKDKKIIFWENLITVPLISQDRIIGALNVEGLDVAALEKFLIVARQFSLEIEKVKLYETVQELAITDGLTGLFVRRYFLDVLKGELERSARQKFKLSFLMIDLDHFKGCNDRFGHLVGDAVLKGVASTFRQNVREIDIIGRYGGEEFSILLPETDTDGANLVAERLRNAVEKQQFNAYGEAVNITISVGTATYPKDALTASDLIESADQALYEAKVQGRNKVASGRRVI